MESIHCVNFFNDPSIVKKKLKPVIWNYFINSYERQTWKRFIKCSSSSSSSRLNYTECTTICNQRKKYIMDVYKNDQKILN